MDTKAEPRRVCRIVAAVEVVQEALKGTPSCTTNLPDDVKVETLAWNNYERTVTLWVTSNTFEPYDGPWNRAPMFHVQVTQT